MSSNFKDSRINYNRQLEFPDNLNRFILFTNVFTTVNRQNLPIFLFLDIIPPLMKCYKRLACITKYIALLNRLLKKLLGKKVNISWNNKSKAVYLRNPKKSSLQAKY